MKVTVRCFASVREMLGAESLDVEVAEGTTIQELLELLAERAPDLLRLPLARAVNRAYAPADRVLEEGDEVAFIPPISGGMDVALDGFELVDGVIDPRALEDVCRSDRDGAVVTFVGVTRNHHDGRAVRGLSYEAYPEMAESTMLRILAEVRTGKELGRVRVAHRLGDVPVGEASVVVVVAAPHRAPAFEACREVMDRLKAEVPIFKKEWFDEPDGGSHWVGELPRVDA
jgi:molybdopterin converting factor subunit 1